jgi:sulfatase maturation enzyme AslB (radical SAM superfamily)
MTKEDILNNLNFEELISLNFMGGEPLYEKLNFYILETLLEHNNSDCFIQITTNGSVGLSDYQKKLLKKFKNLNFNLSIDGVEKVFEYMRFPLKWNNLTENLTFFKTLTDNISVSYTISNLNVLYHNDTTEWFKENNLNYNFNPVNKPSHFRPGALPSAIKEEIFKKYGRTEELKFLIGAQHTDQDDIDFAIMLNTIGKQDAVKDISYSDYMPELTNLFSIFHQI